MTAVHGVSKLSWVVSDAHFLVILCASVYMCSLKLNIWDVGGQRSLRSYWRNYYECTDGVVWVVDSADHRRLADCKAELHSLLKEEVM